MQELGRFLLVAGLALAGVGALLWLGVGRGWLGRLPGDIHFTRGGFTLHFPVVSCLVVSIVLSLVLWLFRR